MPEVATPALVDDDRLVDTDDILSRMLPVSRVTFWNLRKRGDFPPGIRIAPNRIDVTDAFIAYAKPLIGETWAQVPLENGLPRFARFAPVFAAKKCVSYVPQAYRK